ncbi:HD domain-containing protein [Longispora albida]|uniref:HD domain-containing protein n=1 Tax=Longispora albida TaxID=203523 RepID=UPI00037ABBA5|nr:HD domain-containing protein [Longispora albida]
MADRPITDTTVPLFALAAQRNLPRHQHMDPETLNWITDNRPTFLDVPSGTRLPVPQAPPLVPRAWFGEPAVAGTIHGLRHGARVAALASVLAKLQGLSDRDVTEVSIAGALHDCRRLHDRDDPGHGARAAAWFAERSTQIIQRLAPEATNLRGPIIAAAIELHDVPYERFTPQHHRRYVRAPEAVDIVKAADALDRYRLPKLTWWIDDAQLRLIPPDWLKSRAFDLVAVSERQYLDGVGDSACVSLALEGWGSGWA